MWIKVCANTTAEDAQMAVDSGADAVGFVFAPSVRRVTPEEAGAMTGALLGDVERIGVFPDWEFEAVRDAVGVAGLTGVQMHGGYRRELLRRVRVEFGDGVTIAQTVHWEVGRAGSVGAMRGEPASTGGKEGPPEGGLSAGEQLLGRVREIVEDGYVDRVLVDSKVGSAIGGTGQVFDWAAAEVLFGQAWSTRMIVAGGLKAENVGEAVRRLAPWGVDVASGVESVPGRKDRERLRLFVERARAAGEVNPHS